MSGERRAKCQDGENLWRSNPVPPKPRTVRPVQRRRVRKWQRFLERLFGRRG